jgi:hypothetical protein
LSLLDFGGVFFFSITATLSHSHLNFELKSIRILKKGRVVDYRERSLPLFLSCVVSPHGHKTSCESVGSREWLFAFLGFTSLSSVNAACIKKVTKPSKAYNRVERCARGWAREGWWMG